MPFCGVANWSKNHSGLVRFRSHMIVGRHGPWLADPDCPRTAITWHETDAFKSTSEYDDFRRRVREVAVLNVPARQGLVVEVEGRVRRPQGSLVPVLMVTRVYASEVEPSILEELEEPAPGE